MAMEQPRERRFVLAAWITIVVLALARAASAVRFPLSGDEAYYWEWSRRLALGYLDHPPLVAWTIALFDRGTHSVPAIRAGFLLCGVLAALAAYDFARRARGSKTAGALAAILVFCAPLASFTFGFATPDGPYLLAWCASLALAQRALQTNARVWWAALGVSLGVSILARFFGIALLIGLLWAVWRTVRRAQGSYKGPALAVAVTAIIASPVLIWNSENAWAGVRFALAGRHVWHGFSPLRAIDALVFAAVAGALFAAPFVVAALVRIRRLAEPWSDLVWCTALPLLATVAVLSFFEPVEVYWLAGPIVSLACAAAILCANAAIERRALVVATVPSIVVTLLASALAAAPVSTVTSVFQRLPFHAETSSAFEIYSYDELARDIRAQYGAYAVVTDGYGLSSLLDFYGAIPPIVVGYNHQGQEASRWFRSHGAVAAIYVDPVSLDKRPDVLARLRSACGSIDRRPPLVYREAAIVLHAYSVTGCRTFDTRGLAVLNRQ